MLNNLLKKSRQICSIVSSSCLTLGNYCFVLQLALALDPIVNICDIPAKNCNTSPKRICLNRFEHQRQFSVNHTVALWLTCQSLWRCRSKIIPSSLLLKRLQLLLDHQHEVEPGICMNLHSPSVVSLWMK